MNIILPHDFFCRTVIHILVSLNTYIMVPKETEHDKNWAIYKFEHIFNIKKK